MSTKIPIGRTVSLDRAVAGAPQSGFAAEPNNERSLSRDARAMRRDALLLLLLALAVRLVYLDHTPKTDELNHLLAARSLLDEGTLQVFEGGEYTRAWLFTYLTAGMIRLFGESLVVGRILPMVAGALLVPVLYLWVRSVADRPAAWIASLLLCLSPFAIHLSQFARFYTLQVLLFWLGAFLVYRLLTRPPRTAGRAVVMAVLAALAFLLATHLQVVSVVAMAGVVLWVLAFAGPALLRRIMKARYRYAVLAGIVLASAGLALLAVRSGVVGYAWGTFNYADLWAEGSRDNPLYYHGLLLEQYSTLWTLFPLLALIALAARPQPTLFCLFVFGTILGIHSVAAWKSERYIFTAMLAFFALSGIAISHTLPWLRSSAESVLRWLGGGRLSAPLVRYGSAALLVAAALFAVLGNTAFTYTRHMLTRSDAEWTLPKRLRGEPDWAAAAQRLRPLADSTEIVLASTDVEPIYYLDRLDMLLRPVRQRSGMLREFGTVGKIGRRAISTPESLATVMACHHTGLVVIDQKRWRTPHAVTGPLADHLEQHTEPVAMPAAWRMMAFRWQTDQPLSPTECPHLRSRASE